MNEEDRLNNILDDDELPNSLRALFGKNPVVPEEVQKVLDGLSDEVREAVTEKILCTLTEDPDAEIHIKAIGIDGSSHDGYCVCKARVLCDGVVWYWSFPGYSDVATGIHTRMKYLIEHNVIELLDNEDFDCEDDRIVYLKTKGRGIKRDPVTGFKGVKVEDGYE